MEAQDPNKIAQRLDGAAAYARIYGLPENAKLMEVAAASLRQYTPRKLRDTRRLLVMLFANACDGRCQNEHYAAARARLMREMGIDEAELLDYHIERSGVDSEGR